jgi:hypothetical protein
MHRSHARSVFERARKALSVKRPFRCDDCGWRGWLIPLEFGGSLEPAAAPDLAYLDSTLKAAS